ncbi:MAG: AhpC/TSA family antioxidant protein [Bacteroidetes bacterium]|nr:MAG: AhpC/TSA family antioxidant protein [Bacteroidota bacterium]
MTKRLGAYLQGYSAIAAFILLGLVCGDWWLSIALVLAYSAVNLRLHIFREAIYSRLLWTEPVLAFVATLAYVSANLFHDNGWPGWAFPGFFVLLGNLVGWMNSRDRRNIQRLLEHGVINIGVEAPDFTLKDEESKDVTLSSYEGTRSVLLLFVRGDWCPGCHIMLRMYERERKRFHEKNVMLLAIGPDPVGVNKAMVEKLGMDYRILSDENMQTAKKYCVQVQEEGPGSKFEGGIPLPASFLICDKGIVRYTSRADNAGEFLRPEVIFDVLSKI